MASSNGSESAEIRAAKWEAALERNQLPDFVATRLDQAKSNILPWLSTMTPAELLLARTHHIKPLATVSGTCWYHYGYSWTAGHAEGWAAALARIRAEAVACGANAVVDVRMRTIAKGQGSSMDFTLLGTAVRFDNLPSGPEPPIATVPALEFVRLLEMGIVPTGLAVGASYEWLQQPLYGPDLSTGGMSGYNTPLMTLTSFWEGVRRAAHAELRRAAAKQGNGLLADVHFGQLLRRERLPNQSPQFQSQERPAYLGRHIVIGTVIDTPRGAPVPHDVRAVVDMRDSLSPLNVKAPSRHAGFSDEHEGGI